MKYTPKGKTQHLLEFTGLQEFYEYAGGKHTKYNSDAMECSGGWYQTDSLAEALRLGTHGWRDGMVQLKTAVDTVEAKIQEQRGYQFDVTGDFFDVGEVIQGTPECWLTPDYEETRRVQRIIVNVGVMWDVTAQSVRHRGAAVVALVNHLQESGDIVELTVMSRTHGVAGKHDITVNIPVGTTPLDIDAFAFVGHPSFNRRCNFSIREWLLDCEFNQYGQSMNYEQHEIPQGALYLPAMVTDGDFQTLDTAAAWVMRRFTELTESSL